MQGTIFLQKFSSQAEMDRDPFPIRITSVAEFQRLLQGKRVMNISVRGGETLRFLDEVTIWFTDESSIIFRIRDNMEIGVINYLPREHKHGRHT